MKPGPIPAGKPWPCKRSRAFSEALLVFRAESSGKSRMVQSASPSNDRGDRSRVGEKFPWEADAFGTGLSWPGLGDAGGRGRMPPQAGGFVFITDQPQDLISLETNSRGHGQDTPLQSMMRRIHQGSSRGGAGSDASYDVVHIDFILNPSPGQNTPGRNDL